MSDEVITYTFQNGSTRSFTAPARLAAFVREVEALARATPPADPVVLLELIYGARNPLLDATDPAAPQVTASTMEHPAFDVLLDLVEVARAAASPLDAAMRAAALAAACTMPLAAAAERLGLSEHDVLGAIAAHRIIAIEADGIRCDPRSVEACALWMARAAPAPCPLTLVWGDAAGRCFRVKYPSGLLPTGPRRGVIERWERVALLLSETKGGGRKELTYYELAPAPDGAAQVKRLGEFSAAGRFRLARIERNPRAAREAFMHFVAR